MGVRKANACDEADSDSSARWRCFPVQCNSHAITGASKITSYRTQNASPSATPDPMMAAQGRRTPQAPSVWVLDDGEPRKIEVKPGISDGAFTQLAGGDVKEGTPVIIERSWKGRPNTKPDMMQAMRPPGR